MTERRIADILKKIIYIELAAEPNFTSEFTEALVIPHKEKNFRRLNNRRALI